MNENEMQVIIVKLGMTREMKEVPVTVCIEKITKTKAKMCEKRKCTMHLFNCLIPLNVFTI